MFLSEWREFPSAPCLAGKKNWWQLASRCCWNRARPWYASELVFFLVGLRTYQHPGIVIFPLNSGVYCYMVVVYGNLSLHIAHLRQQRHNSVTTASQECHNSVTTASKQRHNSVTTASQECHKSVTRVSQQCHNSVTTASQQRHNSVTTASQLKICDFSGQMLKGFEVL